MLWPSLLVLLGKFTRFRGFDRSVYSWSPNLYLQSSSFYLAPEFYIQESSSWFSSHCHGNFKLHLTPSKQIPFPPRGPLSQDVTALVRLSWNAWSELQLLHLKFHPLPALPPSAPSDCVLVLLNLPSWSFLLPIFSIPTATLLPKVLPGPISIPFMAPFSLDSFN